MSTSYPSTAEDFRRVYGGHRKEELLHAVADLHVINLEQLKQIEALKKELSDNAKAL